MDNNKQALGSNTDHRRAFSRRDFLANTALIGAGLAVGPLSWAAPSGITLRKSTTAAIKGLVGEKVK